MEMQGVRLLTDPMLRRRVGPLRRLVPTPSLEPLRSLDAILLSHLHQDHFDLPSLELLAKDTPILVPRGAERWLTRTGFTAVRGMEPGDTVRRARHERHGGSRSPSAPRYPFLRHDLSLGFLISGATRSTSPETPDSSTACRRSRRTSIWPSCQSAAGACAYPRPTTWTRIGPPVRSNSCDRGSPSPSTGAPTSCRAWASRPRSAGSRKRHDASSPTLVTTHPRYSRCVLAPGQELDVGALLQVPDLGGVPIGRSPE